MIEEKAMEYQRLANGVLMPLVGLGTWDLRGTSGQKSIEQALELGYRLIDTAQMYQNEDIVGAALRASGIARAEIFLTSKLYRPGADAARAYRKAQEDLERSLENMRVDYLDLMLIHEPYELEIALAMYEALLAAYQQGLVKAIGISNFDLSRYQDLCQHLLDGSANTATVANATVAKAIGAKATEAKATDNQGSGNTGPEAQAILPMVNQVESHVYFAQLDLQKAMAHQGTVMQSWGSFTEGRRNIFAEPLLVALGRKYGKTSGQVALRFLTQQGIAVIPKSSNYERQQQNLASLDFTLADSELEAIAKLDQGRSLFGWY